MWKQNIIKRNSDPLAAGNNGVRNKLPGSYSTWKQQQVAQEALKTGDGKPVDTNRSAYKEAKKQDRLERQALGQQATAFGDFMNSGLGKGVMAAGSFANDIAGQFIDRDTSKNPTGYDTQQQIGKAMMSSPIPIVKAAGLAYNTISNIAEATGGNINTITKDQAKDLDISGPGRFLNNVLGTISPGAGWLTSKVEKGQKSFLIDEMSNAYADTVSDIDQAQTLGGGKYLFGKRKISNAVSEANDRNKLLTDINLTNTMRKKSDYAQDLAQQNLRRYQGTNYMDMQVGRKGMKIQSLEEIRELLKNRSIEESEVQKFAEGGSILPTGKLHKELNHLNELNEQFEDLTRKGIPVVTMNEGGELEQVAEIERDEICFSKEITDQLEAYWKDGSEEAMIAAGKLLTEEILYNMKDEGGIVHGDNEGEN